jgi:hypothetical protein
MQQLMLAPDVQQQQWAVVVLFKFSGTHFTTATCCCTARPHRSILLWQTWQIPPHLAAHTST